MKKLMIAVAAVACATVGLADDITSANTVGYTGKSVEQAKFNILSAQFDTVGKDTRSLNDLMTGLTAVPYDTAKVFQTTAPQVTFAGDTYTTYYYLSDAWYGTDPSTGADLFKEGWADGDGTLVDAEVTEGEGFWFRNPTEAAKPNVAGEVVSDTTADVSCGTSFQLTANVFPMAIELNTDAMTSSDIVPVPYDTAKAFQSTATQITISGDTYTTYYYLSDAWYGVDPTTGADLFKEGWADGDGTLVEDTIPVMTGFWTKGVSGAFTLTFKGITK